MQRISRMAILAYCREMTDENISGHIPLFQPLALMLWMMPLIQEEEKPESESDLPVLFPLMFISHTLSLIILTYLCDVLVIEE